VEVKFALLAKFSMFSPNNLVSSLIFQVKVKGRADNLHHLASKVWPLDQQHQHCLELCTVENAQSQKPSDLLISSLHLDKLRAMFHKDISVSMGSDCVAHS
jgi:hypothetical protein